MSTKKQENLEVVETSNAQIDEKAYSIIKEHTYWAVATGMLPIPLLDIAAVTAVQLDMLKQLATFYEIDYSEVQGKSWISSLTAATMSSVLARVGASAIKTIPFVGSVIGMSAMAVLSGASTYAVGQVFARHFEDGGSFLDFNSEDFKQVYEDMMSEGKEFAKDFTDKFKSEVKKDDSKTASARLEDLANLKEKELITAEEYDTMRKEILSNLVSEVENKN